MYLAIIMDVCSGKIVDTSMRTDLSSDLVLAALNDTLNRTEMITT